MGKLYLPPGGRYFGCRHCYNLTYLSVQEHDKRVDALRRNSQALLELMEDPSALSISQLGLALKALRPGMSETVETDGQNENSSDSFFRIISLVSEV